MDEALKALLLLCGANLSAKSWSAFQGAELPPRALWQAGYDELGAEVFTENACARVRELAASGWAEREYEACGRIGVRLIAYGADDYPARLCDLSDPPAVLYWDGLVPPPAARTVGAVGTRRASQYGLRVAKGLGSECARHGAVLISGGALGIDGAAHSGACSSGGVTLAVLGTGIDIIFPPQNRLLFDEIRHCGALVSEFPLGSRGEPWRFPKRNRVVAALSERLVVVEAPAKSGAMITARLALELGREVWAAPGHITDYSAEGSNRLIFDGAYPYISHSAFFFDAEGGGELAEEGAESASELIKSMSPEEASVISALRGSGGKTVDNIALEVKMSAADVLKTIAVLLAKGAVFSSGPGRYSAKV